MKHTIVYDDNKGILVVIMSVYAIEAACFYHFACGGGVKLAFLPVRTDLKWRQNYTKIGSQKLRTIGYGCEDKNELNRVIFDPKPREPFFQ